MDRVVLGGMCEAYIIIQVNRKHPERFCIRQLFKSNGTQAENLFKELSFEDTVGFRNFFRSTASDFGLKTFSTG